ncbi:MAG: winged helix-turn-helix transcriptional regulator [Actinomycetaceae bacterium]|nr:winged helix-turn-helix transcriptional regulator [Actinomycetaceae bacterium]
MGKNLELAEKWSKTFKIMGDPTRLKLLSAIHYAGQHVYAVSELAEVAGIRVATASASLRAMEQNGVVESARDGRVIRYAIADDGVHRLLHWIGTTHDTDNHTH